MTTILNDLMDPMALDDDIRDRYITERRHPDHEGYRIYNYTEAAVYDRHWNACTLQSRGLIVGPSGEVLARPWKKFFNHNQPEGFDLDFTADVEVTDKKDGSLGIVYMAPDGLPAIATRGSFTSEQALHATKLFRDKYEACNFDKELIDEWTFLFEIVYPENRIVLDYGDMDDLIFLGAVHIASGEYAGPRDFGIPWKTPVTEVFECTLVEALAMPPRSNAEGLVIRYLDGPLKNTQVKIKQEDYIQLHRIVTGLTAHRIWERMAVLHLSACGFSAKQIGKSLKMNSDDAQGIIDAGPNWMGAISLPDELENWVLKEQQDLADRYAQTMKDSVELYESVKDLSRKDAALAIAKSPLRSMVFLLMDGKSPAANIWSYIEKPEVPLANELVE